MRLADLLAGLSRLADLGFGLQAGEALRSCALTTELARVLALSETDTRAAFYTALLHHVGCTGFAHETAQLFGDELALNVAAGRSDDSPRDLFTTFLPLLTRGRPPRTRARLTVTALARGNRFGTAYTRASCEVGRDAARRLRLPDAVQRSVYHVYEAWRGRGVPDGLAGEDIPIGSRLARLTGIAVLFDTLGGVEMSVEAVRRRSGTVLDPHLVDQYARRARELLGTVDSGDPREIVLDAEPTPVVSVSRLADVAHVFADLADLKTPYLHGHSRGVANLAREAARQLHLSPATVDDLEVAGLLHDVGRVAVSNAVWEKPAGLSMHEREQVRLHAYHSERILSGSAQLARLAHLVGTHHERLDGAGYHRGCNAAELSMPARVLAAADAYQAMTQERPHRPALAADRAAEELLALTRTARLDAEATTAVLSVAGHRAAVAAARLPAGLTEREVEVLRLVAAGCSNAEVATTLGISRRTAEHHVQHIYTKIGLSGRAAAALFAMEHGLLEPERR